MWEEIWEKYQKQIIITGVAVAVVVMFFSILVGAGRKDSPGSTDPLLASSNSSSATTTSSASSPSVAVSTENHSSEVKANSKMMIDVKGAVKNPGVYEVKPGMRIVDAIDLAGGMNNSADRKNINLAMQLTDQQVVYVPVKGEIKADDPSALKPTTGAVNGADSTTTSSTSGTKSSEIININSASKEELLNLNGVGDKKADQIINYREEKGAFKSIEDLKNVQGIGDKIFEGLKDSITV
jgi:competence protein ComEA